MTDTDRSGTSGSVEYLSTNLMSESEDLFRGGEVRRDVHEHFVDRDRLQKVGVLEEDVVELDRGGFVVVEFERDRLQIWTFLPSSSEAAEAQSVMERMVSSDTTDLIIDLTPFNRAS